MWKEKLQAIMQEKALYGEKINEGASGKEITEFARKAAEELDVHLPDEYLKILEVVNGIEFNSFILYGIDENLMAEAPNQHINGLLESNLIWYENEWQKRYIFFGESSMSWYVYDLSAGKYYELDNPSGEICEEFGKLDCMIEKLLDDALK